MFNWEKVQFNVQFHLEVSYASFGRWRMILKPCVQAVRPGATFEGDKRVLEIDETKQLHGLKLNSHELEDKCSQAMRTSAPFVAEPVLRGLPTLAGMGICSAFILLLFQLFEQ